MVVRESISSHDRNGMELSNGIKVEEKPKLERLSYDEALEKYGNGRYQIFIIGK